MMHTSRRNMLKVMTGGALAAGGAGILAAPALAQEFVVTNNYQNFKRGKIDGLHPDRRILNITWEDLGRIKMRAADLVTNYPSLREGMIVDCNYFDHIDVMIARKSPQADAQAKTLTDKGAQLTGIPGAREPIRMWSMSGMVTKVTPENGGLWLINASNGKPEEPSPNSGEVITMPQVQTAAGKAALATLKPGDLVTTVWTHQTAIAVKIIR
ncbi:hypothetical protein [Reyranella sp.]|uniref:hypothetical protein n=1 Tax=Reyranella sp. TaxID=1929291 RepID=UPI00260ED3C3|nr:hypothetical protein [Reyranella sp.]HQS15225.1 hypothetical protein [Reyranella sp.]HQT11034.1 hypothetical protein [Reyranella sp.]